MGRDKTRDLVDLMRQREGYRLSKGFEMTGEEFEEDGLLEGMSVYEEDDVLVPTEEEVEEALRGNPRSSTDD